LISPEVFSLSFLFLFLAVCIFNIYASFEHYVATKAKCV
jgi:hypothetical protein